MILNRLSKLKHCCYIVQPNRTPSNHQILYSFCQSPKEPDQPDQKQNEKNGQKIRIKAIDHKNINKQAKQLGKDKFVSSYIRKLNKGYLNRDLGKLWWIRKSTQQKNFEQNQKMEQNRQYLNKRLYNQQNINSFIKIAAFSILILVLSYATDSDTQKKGISLSFPVYHDKLNFEGEDLQKIHNYLIHIRKVRIIPEEIEPLNLHQVSAKSQKQLNDYKLKTARIQKFWSRYNIELTDDKNNTQKLQRYEGDPNKLLILIQKLQQNLPKDQKAQVFYDNSHIFTFYDAIKQTLRLSSPFLMIAIPLYIFRRMNPDTIIKSLGQGKKDFKIKSSKNIKTKFDDVAGMEQAKRQITQFVDFLKYGQKYKNIGANIPKGALLTGPPGTGKTMLAKACAGQANVSFFYISGSQFVQIFVGLGASKVRSLFQKARQEAPSIIFIDQIDAIGKKRQNSRNQEKDSTLNQLLVEMDGFSSRQTVIVLAATNRKQTLDNALTRPGRFDRMIEVTLPDIKARQQIFMVHLKPLKVDPQIPLREIAKRLADLSPGFSGADIANLCNEAAIIASRKNSKFIIQKDFQEAAERITAGYVKTNLSNKKTRSRVAYHQAGHAVSSWFLRGGDPLVKLTIIPRSKGALGYAQYIPKNSFIKTRDELIDRVAIMLGGITSQKIFFNNMSSGGSDDLQKVYDLTRRMVTQFGMGQKTYNMTLEQQTYVQKQSIYLSDLMDDQIKIILEQAKQRCHKILVEKKQIVENLANSLLEKETLNNQDILSIMGKRSNFGQEEEQQILEQHIKAN